MLDILHSRGIGVKRYLIDCPCTGAHRCPGNLPELSAVDKALAAEAGPILCPTPSSPVLRQCLLMMVLIAVHRNPCPNSLGLSICRQGVLHTLLWDRNLGLASSSQVGEENRADLGSLMFQSPNPRTLGLQWQFRAPEMSLPVKIQPKLG
jgi:hypothetical protein